MKMPGLRSFQDSIESVRINEVGTQVLEYLSAGISADRLLHKTGNTILKDDTGNFVLSVRVRVDREFGKDRLTVVGSGIRTAASRSRTGRSTRLSHFPTFLLPELSAVGPDVALEPAVDPRFSYHLILPVEFPIQ